MIGQKFIQESGDVAEHSMTNMITFIENDVFTNQKSLCNTPYGAVLL